MAPKEAQSSTFGNNHKHFEHDVVALRKRLREAGSARCRDDGIVHAQVGSKTRDHTEKLSLLEIGQVV